MGSSKRRWITCAVAAIGYIYLGVAFKFICLCVLLYHLLQVRDRRACMALWVAFLTLIYGAAFILNPVAHYLAQVRFTDVERGTVVWLTQATLVGFGAIWLAAVLGTTRAPVLARILPKPKAAGLWIVLLTAAFFPTWIADIAYRGDEGYHIATVHFTRLYLNTLLDKTWVLATAIAWLIGGFFIWRHGSTKKQLWPWLVWAAIGLATGAMAMVGVFADDATALAIRDGRVTRYPLAMSWLSGLLGTFTRENWGGRWVFSTEQMRMLPMLSLFGVGLFMAAGRGWRRASWYFASAAALAIVMVPNFLYHGTMLYLELPAVLLLCVVLADGDACTRRPIASLARRPSWWAMVLVGFVKETAMPILMLLCGLRWLRLVLDGQRRGNAGALLGELRVGTGVFLPFVLYMWLRSGANERPYGANIDQLFDVTLWLRNAAAMAEQYGVLLAVAALGGYVLARQKRWWLLGVNLAALLGVHAFFQADTAEYVGLARFNLMLAPPLVVLSREAILFLVSRQVRWAAPLVCGLMVSNVLLSPVDTQGERKQWGGSSELWYPFVDAMGTVRLAAPQSRLLFGNIDSRYPVAIVANQLRWNPKMFQLEPQDPNDERENLRLTLIKARETQADVVIHRSESAQLDGLEKKVILEGYVLHERYPAAHGALWLFARQP